MAPTPTTNDPLAWALCYHGRGYCTIPADPGTKKPCVPTWGQYQTERPTEQQVRDWFGRDGHSAIALILGAVSGNVAALDFDSDETYEWFRATHPELAQALPTERTARGYHVFFRCTPTPTRRPKGQKIELLSTGAYVIVAPSPGKRWMNPPRAEIAQIDPFALGLERFGIIKPEKGQPREFTEREPSLQRPRDPENGFCVSVKSSVPLSVKSGGLEEKTRRAIDEVIQGNLPTGPGQRNGGVFGFSRALKCIPELRNWTSNDLRPILERWYELALPFISTKDFDQTRADFEHAWERVKWPKGTQLLAIAREMAVQDPDTPREANGYEDPRTQLLVRVCWQLQLLHGEQPFFLAWHAAGDLIGLSHPEAGRRLEMLVRDGVLKITEANTRRRATRYKFAGGTGPDHSQPEDGALVAEEESTSSLSEQAEAEAAIDENHNFTADGEPAEPEWD
jgi:hypothetical protein